jgi:hypothetical protein
MSLFSLKDNWEKVICCKNDRYTSFTHCSFTIRTNSQHNRIIKHSLTTTQNRLWYRNQSKHTWCRARVFTITAGWITCRTDTRSDNELPLTLLNSTLSSPDQPTNQSANLTTRWWLETKHYFPLHSAPWSTGLLNMWFCSQYSRLVENDNIRGSTEKINCVTSSINTINKYFDVLKN